MFVSVNISFSTRTIDNPDSPAKLAPSQATYYQSGGLDADPTPVAAGKRTLVSEY